MLGIPNDPNMVRDASEGLLHRCGVAPKGEGYRLFAEESMLRIGEKVLQRGGLHTQRLGPAEIAARALTSSDFVAILEAVGQKIMRASYDSFPLAHRIFARKRTTRDFKPINTIGTYAGGVLEQVPEGGTIQRRSVTTENVTYSLATYAGIIGVTRRMVINDDVGIFAAISRQRGAAAAMTERRVVWNLIKSNPLAADGTEVFHADHGNTDSAASPTVSANYLAAARASLRKQVAPDGTSINAALRFVVCGPDTETTWDRLLNGNYLPESAATAMTPTLRSVQLLVESEINDEGWFAFTDPNQVEQVEYAYLEGFDGPRVEQASNFNTDNVDLKVALDFGAGIADHRGCFRMTQS